MRFRRWERSKISSYTKDEFGRERRRGGGVENSRYVIVFPKSSSKNSSGGVYKTRPSTVTTPTSAAIYFRKQRANLTREHSSWMHKHVCVPLTAFAIHGYSWKYREKLFHGKGPPVVRRCLLFTLKVARYSRNDSRILNYEEHQFLPRVVSLDRTFCLFICLIISRENRRDFKGFRSKNERGKWVFFNI